MQGCLIPKLQVPCITASNNATGEENRIWTYWLVSNKYHMAKARGYYCKDLIVKTGFCLICSPSPPHWIALTEASCHVGGCPKEWPMGKGPEQDSS